MDIGSRKCWQVAAGDGDRNYISIALAWGVILMGKGSRGAWPACKAALKADEVKPRKLGIVHRFVEEVAEGDLVVLRLGTQQVHAVGEVVGGYAWYEDFGDIDGWDLEHVRRVRWLWRAGKAPQLFGTYTLKLGDSVQQLTSGAIKQWLEGLEVAPSAYEQPLADLPLSCVHEKRSPDVTKQEIGKHLFDKGVAAAAIAALRSQIDDLIGIAEWYVRARVKPSEHETMAYLVLPILRALGWNPQRAAVEWNKVDLALFQSVPRTPHSLAAVVEAKQRNRACLSARSQALDYATKNGTEACRRLVVTDGIRYGVYVRDASGFPEHPTAYLNLLRMRESYPVLRCAGAAEALLMMSADWTPE